MRNKKKSGFTLIELVISFAIFMIILVPVLSIVLSTVNINKNAEDKQQATDIAQDYVEKFKTNPQGPSTGSDNKDGFLVSYTLSNAGSSTKPSGSKSDEVTDPDLDLNIDSSNNLYANGLYITKMDSSSIIDLTNDDDATKNNIVINYSIAGSSGNYSDSESVARKSETCAGTVRLTNNSAEDVTVNINNNCSDGTLSAYILKGNLNSGSFLPGEVKGNIKIITDTEGSSQAGGASRVIKIAVTVSKNSKTLSQITTYTSLAD